MWSLPFHHVFITVPLNIYWSYPYSNKLFLFWQLKVIKLKKYVRIIFYWLDSFWTSLFLYCENVHEFMWTRMFQSESFWRNGKFVFTVHLLTWLKKFTNIFEVIPWGRYSPKKFAHKSFSSRFFHHSSIIMRFDHSRKITM